MNAIDFAESFKQLRDSLLEDYFAPGPDRATEVGARLAALQLTSQQSAELRQILGVALTDALYTVMMALDGEANLGGRQESFTLHDSAGNLVFEPGELEAAAWSALHGGSEE